MLPTQALLRSFHNRCNFAVTYIAPSADTPKTTPAAIHTNMREDPDSGRLIGIKSERVRAHHGSGFGKPQPPPLPVRFGRHHATVNILPSKPDAEGLIWAVNTRKNGNIQTRNCTRR